MIGSMLREKLSITKNVQGAVWNVNNPLDAWKLFVPSIKGDNNLSWV
ncbi:MAG: hypothetical protein M0T74_00575 [Desulfitobacterium hafniense]|nr:hypothetical protein [Desulfosporosinus sp.]MDA8226200.1 hypothetical protein [Desulfitobacterium hafniense]